MNSPEPNIKKDKTLSHFDPKGDARMVDVGEKPVTRRVAVAEGHIRMQTRTIHMCTKNEHEKGDVLGVARIAGIMAAKQTAHLIPLCHSINLTKIDVQLMPQHDKGRIYCRCRVETEAKSGVEIEALTAVQFSLLTVYDMCKSVERSMVLSSIRLLEKQGGKSGTWLRDTAADNTR